jgi:hypothetical protein
MAWLVPAQFARNRRGWLVLGATTLVGWGVACSAGSEGKDPPGPITAAPGAGGNSALPGSGGTGTILNPDLVGSVDPNDTRDIAPRQPICDEQNVCVCLRLALLGTLDSAASENDKDTSVFVDWLNSKSEGSATATMVTTKPTLDDAWLANYDILIVANVNDWTFSAEEKAAVERWVLDTGGGIIALTGFLSQATEPAATSQLIEFSGVSYTSAETALEGQGQNIPVYYQGDTTQDMRNCLWGWGGNAGITTPVEFADQPQPYTKLTYALDYVGAFKGFGVNAPDGALVAATDPTSGQNMAVALTVNERGRVFAWGDEWVIYANQWVPERATPDNTQRDQYNPCYIPDNGDGPEFHSVQTIYQTKQFWYNAINWVAPPNECNFQIIDPEVQIVR